MDENPESTIGRSKLVLLARHEIRHGRPPETAFSSETLSAKQKKDIVSEAKKRTSKDDLKADGIMKAQDFWLVIFGFIGLTVYGLVPELFAVRHFIFINILFLGCLASIAWGIFRIFNNDPRYMW